MSALGTMTIVNLPDFLTGIENAQKLKVRYMKSELSRGVKRVRKKFINEQLKGRPGIKATKLAHGKNVFTFTGGTSEDTLQAKIGISRILHVHEKGMKIPETPLSGNKWLYLSKKSGGGRGTGQIFARVRQVTIPARLHFRQLVAQESPDVLRKTAEAGMRAVDVSLSKALKKTVGL